MAISETNRNEYSACNAARCKKTEMTKRSVVKSVESVLRLRGSLWWERFVEEVGLEPRVKERELWMVRVVSLQE